VLETLMRVVLTVVADGAVDTSTSAARVMIVEAATFTVGSSPRGRPDRSLVPVTPRLCAGKSA
jgi:hypothetical protein